MTLGKLLEFARKNPLELDNPICVVNNKPITLREAIKILQTNSEIAYYVKKSLEKLGLDPPKIELSNEAWELALARWEKKPDNFAIDYNGRLWTKKEIIEQIKKRTPIGANFALLELEYLKYML